MDFPLIIILGVFFVWNITITYLLIAQRSKIKKVTKDGKNTTVIEAISDVIEKEKSLKRTIIEIDKKVEDLIFASQFYIQKIGLVRFNPFNDTGGDQSFILALVDDRDTGVVISGLHTRNGTRWYAKEVENGKGVGHDLSNDEKKAINAARKRTKK
jgi:hypothetical protein